jgi:hypothetical protein
MAAEPDSRGQKRKSAETMLLLPDPLSPTIATRRGDGGTAARHGEELLVRRIGDRRRPVGDGEEAPTGGERVGQPERGGRGPAHGLERAERAQGEDGEHDPLELVPADGGHGQGQGADHGGADTGERERGGRGGGDRPPLGLGLERAARGVDAPEGVVDPTEGQQLGRALQQVDHVGRQLGAPGPLLDALAAGQGEQRRPDERDEQGGAEDEAGGGEEEAHDDDGQRGDAERDDEGVEAAQVEVLERVDVLDGPARHVAAAPVRQSPRGERLEAVEQPDAPPGQRPERGVVRAELLRVAQGGAQHGDHLDRGQQPGDGAEPGSQGGAVDQRARPGEEPDPGRRRQEAEGETPRHDAQAGWADPQKAAQDLGGGGFGSTHRATAPGSTPAAADRTTVLSGSPTISG